MLYDPKWDRDVNFAGVSLRGLISWLETQPPTTSYDYCRVQTCVMAQYLQSLGVPADKSTVEFGMCDFDGEGTASSPRELLNWVAQGDGGNIQTYGAALQRARAALSRDQRHAE